MTLSASQAEADAMVSKIQAAAEEFKTRVSSLEGDVTMMDWSGAAKEAFVTVCQDVKTQFTTTVEGLIEGRAAEGLKGAIAGLLEADASIAQGLSGS
jgi:uncharacterized protein YukE